VADYNRNGPQKIPENALAIKKKILIADDEYDLSDIIKKRLEANGFAVVTASTGEEALEKFAREKPDALLLDIMMPGISGLEVLQKVRQADRNIPIFITTAFTSEERFKEANQLNATGFIVKTGNFEEHIESIKQAIALSEKYRT